MIKYIKSKISIKIFLLTMVVLMGIAGISYGFVAALMPRTYSDSLNRTLAAKAKQLAESLESAATPTSPEWSFWMKKGKFSENGTVMEEAPLGRETLPYWKIPFQEQQRIQKCLRKELWMG